MMQWLLIIPGKPHFALFWSLSGPKILKQDFSQKKLFRLILNLCYYNFMQKSEKFWESISHKTWKASFWTHFGPWWPKNIKTRFFPKKIIEVNFKTLSRCNLSLYKLHKMIKHSQTIRRHQCLSILWGWRLKG